MEPRYISYPSDDTVKSLSLEYAIQRWKTSSYEPYSNFNDTPINGAGCRNCDSKSGIYTRMNAMHKLKLTVTVEILKHEPFNINDQSGDGCGDGSLKNQ